MHSYRLQRSDGGEARSGVAHIGCPAAGGRLLRVRVADHKRRRIRVACDRCDAVHEGAGPGRALRAGEPEPELVELAESAPTAPPRSGRRLASDSEIVAALSATETRPAAEIAKALGYADASGLVARLKRMNARADAPVAAIKRHGRRTMLRLVSDPGDSVTQTESCNANSSKDPAS